MNARIFLSPCDGMHVCTDSTSVYTLTRKRFCGMESDPMLTPREKIPSTGKILLRGGSEPTTLLQAVQRAHHTTNELFRPPMRGSNTGLPFSRRTPFHKATECTGTTTLEEGRRTVSDLHHSHQNNGPLRLSAGKPLPCAGERTHKSFARPS